MSGLGPEHSIDLGGGIYMRWLSWAPDRDLNPQYADLADNEKTGLIIGHVHPDGVACEGVVLFDTPENHRGSPERPLWQVHALDPLHLEPSILRQECGLHGHIRGGRWEGC